MDIDNTQVEQLTAEAQGEATAPVVQDQEEVSDKSTTSKSEVSSDSRPNNTPDTDTDDASSEPQQTFDRKYVESLRKESAKYRDKAKRAEELEKRLHRSLVAQDGRLADPDDLEFNPDHLDNPDALSDAIANLVAKKPGLRAQRLSGDIGAGVREQPKPPTTDLLSIMKGLI